MCSYMYLIGRCRAVPNQTMLCFNPAVVRRSAARLAAFRLTRLLHRFLIRDTVGLNTALGVTYFNLWILCLFIRPVLIWNEMFTK